MGSLVKKGGTLMTDFITAAKLGTFLSKPYAEPVFELLSNYRDLSASEVASRIRLHIRTAQDYLEGLAELGILKKTEVYEKKRPYFRYSLLTDKLEFSLDLSYLKHENNANENIKFIREANNNDARFITARSDSYISNVVVWSGNGREQEERKINLTMPQGKFLYHLPFPNAVAKPIKEIMQDARVDESLLPEINDLVEMLISLNVIEEDSI